MTAKIGRNSGNAWRGKEPMPYVNFKETVVLIAVNRDPNQISVSLRLDQTGNLRVSTQTTLVGYVKYTTAGYQFALISRTGIRTIRGKKLDP